MMETIKPVTDLAESYEYDENTKTYTFHLRDGVNGMMEKTLRLMM